MNYPNIERLMKTGCYVTVEPFADRFIAEINVLGFDADGVFGDDCLTVDSALESLDRELEGIERLDGEA